MKDRMHILVFAILITTAGCGRSQPRAAVDAGQPRTSASRDVPSQTLSHIQERIADGDINGAIATAWALARERPDDLDVQVALAGAFALAERNEDALEAIEKALNIDPAAAGAQLTYGSILLSLGRIDEAIRATLIVLQTTPDHLAALANLATAYSHKKMWGKEVETLAKMVTLLPDDAMTHLSYARALLNSGRSSDALAAAHRASERDPEAPQPHLFMALIHYDEGEVVRAMDRADIVHRLDPDNNEAVELFRASFYIAVARTLHCEHGPRPWSNSAVTTVLDAFRREGLEGADVFHEIDARFSKDPMVMKRVKAAAERCKSDPLKAK